MKKAIALGYLFVFVSFVLNAQTSVNIKYTSSKSIGSIKKDVAFVIDSVSYDPNFKSFSTGNSTQPTYLISITQDGKSSSIPAFSFPKSLDLKSSEDNLDNYWFAKNLESLRVVSEIKELYKTRSELEKDANDYLRTLSKYNLIFDDPFLESYLYTVVSKILPYKRADGFPYDLKIKIVKDPSMNASVFPNGVMLVNTGILALVHSEDELIAILAHEVAHFVANHTLVNLRKMAKAQNRAEALTALAVGLAGVASAAMIPYGYYDASGSLLKSTALLSYVAASQYLEKMGMEYSKEQEEEADQMALEVLKYLGCDKNALATVFKRMADTYTEEGNWAAYYVAGDHPSLKNRIEYCGKPNSIVNSQFEKVVSFAVTQAALSKYSDGRFRQALKLANQNIENGVGTDDDFLIKARCLLNLFSDNTHNKEALENVKKAKTINSSNANILRTEIIAHLRLNDLSEARTLLDSYTQQLSETMSNEANKDGYYYSFLTEEFNWARNMTVKVQGM